MHEATEEQRHALEYHYPNVEEIYQLAKKVDARIYEKTMFHHDFLTFRVGLVQLIRVLKWNSMKRNLQKKKMNLVQKARDLHSRYKKIEHVPVTTSLMKGPIGYIGQRTLVIEQLQMLVLQTAFFHSYHELQFIVIFPEEEKDEWEWMRWLPHAKLQDLNIRGFVYNERTRDQVLTSLYQILKERNHTLTEKENSQEKQYFTPHYVVFITDEKIVLDHTIMEFFNEDPSELGVSLVFVQDVLQSLPEHVETVIDIRDAKSGNVLLEEGELVNQAFVPDHFPDDFEKENISRSFSSFKSFAKFKKFDTGNCYIFRNV